MDLNLFQGSRTTLLVDKNCDPTRCYKDVPGVAGWREQRDPVSGHRHWSHVGMQLTTYSLREVVRYGGLEELLLLGEWGIFMHVPEEIPLYEDRNWRAPYYADPSLEGEPAGYLQRGAVVASPGLAAKGIAEIVLPDEDNVIRQFYTWYRFPPHSASGKRILVKLPTREHNEDRHATHSLTSGEFRCLGMPWLTDERAGYLQVNSTRDPTSPVIGYLSVNTVVSLSQLIGTRAQLYRIEDGDTRILGGWISVMTLDGGATMERILYETDQMREQAEHKRHHEEIAAIVAAGGDDDIEFPWAEKPPPPPWIEPIIISMPKKEIIFKYEWHQQLQKSLTEELEEARARLDLGEEVWRRRLLITNKHLREVRLTADFSLLEDQFPMVVALKEKVEKKLRAPLPDGAQREKIVGGWRQMVDTVWNKHYYFDPISGRGTYGIMEVLRTGGLEDLLLSRTWHIAVIDPLAAELVKLDDWQMDVYGEHGLVGRPVHKLDKGTFLIVKHFDTSDFVATLLLPAPEPGGSCWTGYCKYRMNDGRAILRSMIPYPEDMPKTTPDGEPNLAEEPEYDVLEGPYEVIPPEEEADIVVNVDQDMVSRLWAKLPRGYKLCEMPEEGFEEVAGTRARLPDMEGGGWVSLFTADGRPLFKKEPTIPAAERGIRRFSKVTMPVHMPVRWPHIGCIGMPKLGDPGYPQPMKEMHYATFLPTILEQLGGGRALCDWNRVTLEGAIAKSKDWSMYINPLTKLKSSLDELLRLKVWKPVIMVLDVPIRDQIPPHSTPVSTWPCHSLIIAEWVSPSNAVRLLVPAERDDHRPRHLWSDLGGSEGSYLVPLMPGREFWVEPKGGHLSYEVQSEENYGDPFELVVREEIDAASKRVIGLRRADAVQIAEVYGRFARVVITFRLGIKDWPHGGWIDLFDEAGWSQLKIREQGVMHPLQIQAEGLGEFPPPPSIIGKAKAEQLPVVLRPEAQLPTLLWQIGELEQASNLSRDWHEQTDPVWGRLYYVNRWSGQVIHSLGAGGVYSVAVRLTLWLTNIALDNLICPLVEIVKQAQMRAGPADIQPGDKEAAWARLRTKLEEQMKEPFGALADVPLDMMDVKIVDCANELIDVDPDDEDGKTRLRSPHGGELPPFRLVATITAPGAHAAWAAGDLKKSMADGERFNNLISALIGQIPELQSCKIDSIENIQLAQATLDELDIPPWVRPPTPPPPADPPPPVDDEFVELRKNIRYFKPKILDLKSCKLFNLAKPKGFAAGDLRALAEGLDLAARDHKPFVEEIHFWDVNLDDFQFVCFKQAFERGRLAKLTTLLLDGNNIGALGAQSLGDGLKHCEELRELSMAQNPIGIGFVHICKNINAGLVVLNVSYADLTDVCAVAVGQALPNWLKMSKLSLCGNKEIGLHAAEVVARGAVACPSLKLADLSGSAAKPYEVRVARVFEDAGDDPKRMRV